AHGTWNANGFVPARPSAWSLFDLGVLDPVIVTTPGKVTLEQVASTAPGATPRLVAIPAGGDEYFLLENRLQDPNDNQLFDFHDVDGDSLFEFYVDDYEGAEFDFFLPGDGTGSGLLIWHVDQSVITANFVSNTVVANPAHKGIDLEEADGIEDMDGFPRSLDSFGSPNDAYRAGNATSFTDDTVPNSRSSYGVPTLVSIEGVSPAGPTMTFTVGFDGRKGGSWPVTITGPVGPNPAAIGDFVPGTPGLETVYADTTGAIWVIAADGSQPLGSPFDRVGPDLATAPALGDIDGDSQPDLVVAASDGRIFAWHGDGRGEVRDGDQNPGTTGVWAVTGRPLAHAVPVILPFAAIATGGGGPAAVVVGSEADSSGTGALLLCRDNGQAGVVQAFEVPGDATAPGIVFRGLAPIVLAPVVYDGRTRFFAMAPLAKAGAGSLTEVTPSGGQPAAVRSLIAGDLDGDGTYEAIAADDQGQIWVFATGVPLTGEPGTPALSLVAGWPFQLGSDIAHDLALADVDQDGRHEILVSSFDGKLYALNFNGTAQLSFPIPAGSVDRLPPRLVPSPLAIDLAGGPGPELLFAGGDGRAFAYDAQGHALPGWPRPGPAASGTGLVIEDLDQDGQLDLVVPSDYGSETVLIAYDLGITEGPGSTWRAYRGGPEHMGVLTLPPSANPESGPLLSQLFVFPNPVTGDRATIHFQLGRESRVRVQILDALGRVVAEPMAGDTLPERTDHEVRWDVRNAASGVYLLRLTVAGEGRDQIEIAPFAVTR
ncbi:MAG TPA: T9SS type A sorting domain-containing protein, partial [Candidatus Udaeobacter sp.]|nr:T9SS type A sorting domain-containing protein [Candidatus Udaeobacter sp.]